MLLLWFFFVLFVFLFYANNISMKLLQVTRLMRFKFKVHSEVWA